MLRSLSVSHSDTFYVLIIMHAHLILILSHSHIIFLYKQVGIIIIHSEYMNIILQIIHQCFIEYDLSNPMKRFNIYKSNEAYSNISMRYIFKPQQCVNNCISENYYVQIKEFEKTSNKTINKQINHK